jgi:phosphoglycerol transferase MdoB-like AlkP superfamily enzyme
MDNKLNLLNKIFRTRIGLPALFSGVFLVFSALLRTTLLVKDFASTDLSSVLIFKIFFGGLFYDLVTLSYALIPLSLYLLLIPRRWFAKPFFRAFSATFFFLLLSLLIFDGVAEWLFWDEFSTRFNFIAVDYLIYTTEVIGNIKESYSLPVIFGGIAALTGIIFWLLWPKLKLTYQDQTPFRNRIKIGGALLVLPLLSWFLVENNTVQIKQNSFDDELAHNGIYQLFSAYLNNELDYNTFYVSEPDKKVFTRLRKLLKSPHSKFVNKDIFDVTRQVDNEGTEKPYNVMFITVESFSAEFMTMFGNQEKITPNLDTIAQRSIVFDNMFATGTRTIRGLEALTLSLPPTPGYSIVKRPHNENQFSSGFIFREKGYDTKFMYGGFGYFDNMNYFFGNNGFKVVDRGDFTDAEITFANNWGVCDGDLFNRTLKEADSSFAKKKPFFSFIMTTSNHRPFTYPDGVIDIPSHSGRNGAVKYTDFAIAKFLRDAKNHPWFANTVFVIVADHCASSAGKTEIPVEKYHIPALIYAPGIFKPQVVSQLTSQIDLVPTLLGLMHFDYKTKFFGQDIFDHNPERVFVGTYQKLGYFNKDNLAVLAPKKYKQTFLVHKPDFSLTRGKKQPTLLRDAIAYYQGASYLFAHGNYKFVSSKLKATH